MPARPPTSRWRAALLGVVAATLVAAGCGGSSDGSEGSSAPDGSGASGGSGAPTGVLAVTGTDLDGNPVDVASLVGDDIVVWFWAPW